MKKNQISKIRNENGEITTDNTEIQRIIIANLVGVSWHVTMGLTCASLVISDAEPVFVGSLANGVSPLLPPSCIHNPVEICLGPEPHVSNCLPTVSPLLPTAP